MTRGKKSGLRNSWCVPPKGSLVALPHTVLPLYIVLALHSEIPYIVSVTRVLLKFDLLLKLAHYVVLFLHSCMETCMLIPHTPKLAFGGKNGTR